MSSPPAEHMKMLMPGSNVPRKNSSESSISWCIFSAILLAVAAALSIFFAVTRFGGFNGHTAGQLNRGVDLTADVRRSQAAPAVIRHEPIADSKLPAGFFIDIGASSSQVRSSPRTRHLEKKGYAGVCAVPFPGDFADRMCRVVALPVSAKSGEKVKVQDCSSSSPQNFERLISNLVAKAPDCPEVETNTVGIVDLLSLAAAPPVVDYIALDTNGTELSILSSFPVEEFCARSWTVKHNYNDNMAKIRHVLEVAMGCRVREGAAEYWARCPCDKNGRNDGAPARATGRPNGGDSPLMRRKGDASMAMAADGHQTPA